MILNISDFDKVEKNNFFKNYLIQNFSFLSIYPDSEVLILVRFSESIVKIVSVYRPGLYQNLVIENRGLWNQKTGINFKDSHVSSRRRMNIKNNIIKSSIVVNIY